MIRFNFYGMTFAQAWFDEPIERPYPDVAVLRHSRTRPTSGPVSIKHSLVNDLSAPETEIWDRIGKTCRYKIRRAENKDGATWTIDRQPSAAEVAAFADFYDQFARQKGLAPIARDRFGAIATDGRLWLSQALLGDTVVVRHAHIITGDTARMLYSASLFRDVDADTRSAIGRTNRLLHWQDMLAFRATGFRTYDWGGVFADETAPDQKGINEFKREFGGEPIEYFEGYQACSTRGRLAIALFAAREWLRGLADSLKPRSPVAG